MPLKQDLRRNSALCLRAPGQLVGRQVGSRSYTERVIPLGSDFLGFYANHFFFQASSSVRQQKWGELIAFGVIWIVATIYGLPCQS